MTFVPFQNTALACINFTIGGVPLSICLHFTHATPPTDSNFQTLANRVGDEYEDHMMPVHVDTLFLEGTTVYDLSSETGVVKNKDFIPAVAGGVGNTPVPLNVACVISHYSDVRGRSGRGRTYLPGLSEVWQDEKEWGNTFIPTIVTGWSDFIGGIEANTDWTLVVASRYTNGAPRVQGVTNVVTQSVVKNDIGTRRKRLPGDFAR